MPGGVGAVYFAPLLLAHAFAVSSRGAARSCRSTTPPIVLGPSRYWSSCWRAGGQVWRGRGDPSLPRRSVQGDHAAETPQTPHTCMLAPPAMAPGHPLAVAPSSDRARAAAEQVRLRLAPSSQPTILTSSNQPTSQPIQESFMAAASCVQRNGPWNQSPTLKVYSSYHVIFAYSSVFHNIPAYVQHLQYI